jgi:hypothetical protein
MLLRQITILFFLFFSLQSFGDSIHSVFYFDLKFVDVSKGVGENRVILVNSRTMPSGWMNCQSKQISIRDADKQLVAQSALLEFQSETDCWQAYQKIYDINVERNLKARLEIGRVLPSRYVLIDVQEIPDSIE